MTLENIFLFFLEYQTVIICLMLVAPWLSWLICVIIPGKSEEPIVLSINLGAALLTLLAELGYLLYATNNGGWTRVVKEADIILLLAPLYYVGISLWLSRQRLPLSKLAPVRVIRGLVLICAAYLMLSWIASKIKIIVFSYLPFGIFLLFIFTLLALGYWGYLQIINKDNLAKQRNNNTTSHNRTENNKLLNDDIAQELNSLRKNIKNDRDS